MQVASLGGNWLCLAQECSIISWTRSLARCASARRIPSCRQFREALLTGWRLQQPETTENCLPRVVRKLNWNQTRICHRDILNARASCPSWLFFLEEVSSPSSGLSADAAATSLPLLAPELGCIAVSLTLASQLASLLYLFSQRYTVSCLNPNSSLAFAFMQLSPYVPRNIELLNGCSSVELPSERLCMCGVKAGP